MNKIILKIFLILLVAFVSLTTFVCATDINLDLPGTDSPTDNIDNSNNSEVPNNTDTTNQENNNVIDNTLNNNNSESEVLQPTGISSAQETSLMNIKYYKYNIHSSWCYYNITCYSNF